MMDEMYCSLNFTFDIQVFKTLTFFNVLCWFTPFGYLYFSMNERELGAGIDPGMAFNPFPSSILVKTRRDLNPQPLDRESSPLTTRLDFSPFKSLTLLCIIAKKDSSYARSYLRHEYVQCFSTGA